MVGFQIPTNKMLVLPTMSYRAYNKSFMDVNKQRQAIYEIGYVPTSWSLKMHYHGKTMYVYKYRRLPKPRLFQIVFRSVFLFLNPQTIFLN